MKLLLIILTAGLLQITQQRRLCRYLTPKKIFKRENTIEKSAMDQLLDLFEPLDTGFTRFTTPNTTASGNNADQISVPKSPDNNNNTKLSDDEHTEKCTVADISIKKYAVNETLNANGTSTIINETNKDTANHSPNHYVNPDIDIDIDDTSAEICDDSCLLKILGESIADDTRTSDHPALANTSGLIDIPGSLNSSKNSSLPDNEVTESNILEVNEYKLFYNSLYKSADTEEVGDDNSTTSIMPKSDDSYIKQSLKETTASESSASNETTSSNDYDTEQDSDGDPNPERAGYIDDYDTEYNETGGAGTEVIPDTLIGHRDTPACHYQPPESVNIKKEGRRVSEIQCEYNMWQYKHAVLERERKRNECQKAISLPEIIGGRDAIEGDFPHMGAIGWRKRTYDKDYKFMCGSSLINVRFALTAAHCSAITEDDMNNHGLASTEPEIIRFTDTQFFPRRYQDVHIDGPVIRHPKHSYRRTYYDVALVRLAQDINIAGNTRPACLWTGHLNGHAHLNISGWGQTSLAKYSTQPEKLQYATLDVIDKYLCNDKLDFIKNNRWWGVARHQFCAGKSTEIVDTCQGDSGGPVGLQLPLPSDIDKQGVMHHIVGITSFGKGCGLKLPGIYVNVSDPKIQCWIEKTAWPEEPNQFCP